jgi:galacturonosyltransferase
LKKVLILANDNSTIYNFRRELLGRLREEGYEVFVSVPPHQRNAVFEKMGCRVLQTDISRKGTNPLKEWLVYREYLRLLRDVRPDVALTYTIKPNIYGSLACRKMGIPYINNVTGLGSMLQRENIISKFFIFLQKLAFRKSYCVFFQNSSNMRYFKEKKAIGDRAALLPGSGVNLDLHKFCPYPPEEGGIRFIVVSRLRYDKGYEELFRAIELLNERIKGIAEFHIVGWIEERAYETRLRELEKRLPIVYHGEISQEEVHELIASSHCLIHPSHHEGMSNVMMEAAAAGRPLIASDSPGCREIIDVNQTGFTFQVKSAEALAGVIERFLSLSMPEREKMGRKGHMKMAKYFDRRIVVDAYIEKIAAICQRTETTENVTV